MRRKTGKDLQRGLNWAVGEIKAVPGFLQAGCMFFENSSGLGEQSMICEAKPFPHPGWWRGLTSAALFFRAFRGVE